MNVIHPDCLEVYAEALELLVMDVTFKTNVYNRNVLNVVSATPMNNTMPVSIHMLDGMTKEHYLPHL